MFTVNLQPLTAKWNRPNGETTLKKTRRMLYLTGGVEMSKRIIIWLENHSDLSFYLTLHLSFVTVTRKG